MVSEKERSLTRAEGLYHDRSMAKAGRLMLTGPITPTPSCVVAAFIATLALATSGCGSSIPSARGTEGPKTTATVGGAFDPERWKKPVKSCTESQRGRMVEEVVTDYLKPRMSMDDARKLLGAPDEISADETWIYNVDFESDGLLGTCVVLALYAKGDILERAAVMRDD
jgi:hypothetical protein